MSNPPLPVLLVFEAVAVFTEIIPPIRTLGPTREREQELLKLWTRHRKILSDSSFFQKIIEKNIFEEREAIDRIRPYVALSEFDPGKLTKVSLAAKALCAWIHSVVTLYDAEQNAIPLRGQSSAFAKLLREERAKLQEMKGKIEIVTTKIQEVCEQRKALLKEREQKTIELNATIAGIEKLKMILTSLDSERQIWSTELSKLKETLLDLDEKALSVAKAIVFSDYSQFEFYSISDFLRPLNALSDALAAVQHDGSGRFKFDNNGRPVPLVQAFSERPFNASHFNGSPVASTTAMLIGLTMSLGAVPILCPGMSVIPLCKTLLLNEFHKKEFKKLEKTPFEGIILEVGDTLSNRDIATLNAILASRLTVNLSFPKIKLEGFGNIPVPSGAVNLFIALRLQRVDDMNFVISAIAPSFRKFLVPIRPFPSELQIPPVSFRIFQKTAAKQAMNQRRALDRTQFFIQSERAKVMESLQSEEFDEAEFNERLERLEEKERHACELARELTTYDEMVLEFNNVVPLVEELVEALFVCADSLPCEELLSIAVSGLALRKITSLKELPDSVPPHMYPTTSRRLISLGHYVLSIYVSAVFAATPHSTAIFVALMLLIHFDHFFCELEEPEEFVQFLFQARPERTIDFNPTLSTFFENITEENWPHVVALFDDAEKRLGGFTTFPPPSEAVATYTSLLTKILPRFGETITDTSDASLGTFRTPLRSLAFLSVLGLGVTSADILETLRAAGLRCTGLAHPRHRSKLITDRSRAIHGSIASALENSSKLLLLFTSKNYDPIPEIFYVASKLDASRTIPLVVSAFDLDLIFKVNGSAPMIIDARSASVEVVQHVCSILRSTVSRFLRVVLAEKHFEEIRPLCSLGALCRLEMPNSFVEALGLALTLFASSFNLQAWQESPGADLSHALLFSCAILLGNRSPSLRFLRTFCDLFRLLAPCPAAALENVAGNDDLTHERFSASSDRKLSSAATSGRPIHMSLRLSPTAGGAARLPSSMLTSRAYLPAPSKTIEPHGGSFAEYSQLQGLTLALLAGSPPLANSICQFLEAGAVSLTADIFFHANSVPAAAPMQLTEAFVFGPQFIADLGPVQLFEKVREHIHSLSRAELALAEMQPLQLVAAIQPPRRFRELATRLRYGPVSPARGINRLRLARLRLNTCVHMKLRTCDYQYVLQPHRTRFSIARCECVAMGAFLEPDRAFCPTDSPEDTTFGAYISLELSSRSSALAMCMGIDGETDTSRRINIPVEGFPEATFVYIPDIESGARPVNFFRNRAFRVALP
eukprot:gnl/Chilomastix_cuspidata/7211.p1 GENE.gnl/Chilomastix_cuspidata/7211~~gnl/Chilomastix_cuspidata/7211.p1  ORF type:complete len:1447 (+),score=99.10 gnl/Chilomastix_cuspidata/7211:491-4342(+)